MQSAHVEPKPPSWKWFLLAISIVVTVTVLYAVGTIVYGPLPNWEQRGQFGDMFGAINTVFSGAAFAGLVYTILLQRHDLAIQREENRLARDELSAQNAILGEQLASMRHSFDFQRAAEEQRCLPDFSTEIRMYSGRTAYLNVQNAGGKMSSICFENCEPAGLGIEIQRTDCWSRGEWQELRIQELVLVDGERHPNIMFSIQYTDELGRRVSLRVLIPAGSWRLIKDGTARRTDLNL